MPAHRRIARLLTVVLLAAIPLSGCKRDSRLPDLVPVEGPVTLDKRPLVGAAVTFIPSGETKGRGAAGMTDVEGRYRLTEQDGSAGIPIGQYRVVISKLIRPDGTDFVGERLGPMDTDARELLPPRYSDYAASELTADVPAGGGSVPFALQSE